MKCDNDEDDTLFEAYFLDTLLFIKAFNKTLGQECNNLRSLVRLQLLKGKGQNKCKIDKPEYEYEP